MHSIGRFRNVPFFRNPTLHSILLALLLFGLKVGPSGWNYYLDHRLEARLNNEYASGWAVYTFDGTTTYVPKVSRLNTDYDVDWQSGKIELTAHGTYRITFPSYDFKGVRFRGNGLEIPADSQFKTKFNFIFNDLDQADYLVGEVIQVRDSKVEFVMGFVPR